MFKYNPFFLAIVWLVPVVGFAQQTNPFELKHRLPEQAMYTSVGSSADSGLNPFDVVKHQIPGQSGRLTDANQDTFKPLRSLPTGSSIKNSFLFVMLFLLLVYMTFSVAYNRKALARAWNSFLNDNALGIAQREAAGLVGSTPYYLLYSSFLLNAGMFFFLVARYFWSEKYNNFTFLVLCILSATVLFSFKHLVLQLVNRILPVGDAIERYNFLIVVFNCILGLFLVPFNFLIAFSENLEGFLIFWTIGLTLLFYAYRGIRALSIGTRFLTSYPFHFLLYLCSVEVAPVLLLLKIAMNQGIS